MARQIYIVALIAFIVSAVLTGLVRKFAVAGGVLDVPNDRSSHTTPTPTGGGIAVVLTFVTVEAVLTWAHVMSSDFLRALLGGGTAVAIVGFIDDRYQLSATIRLAVHIAAAIWALVYLGGLPPLRIGTRVIEFGWTGYAVGTIAIVWALNLFNFMDGIDGIAASQGVFISWGGAAAAAAMGLSTGVVVLCLAFGAACCGFLLWNWPPARIFMGDVGSGFIGFVLAVLAVASARENPVALWVWLILGGVFFVDATVTLIRRLVRGEEILKAHRNHAYQWLSRRWGSHKRVTVAVAIVNLIWLLPSALLVAIRPNFASWITVTALVPIVILAVAAGAGQREHTVTVNSGS